MFQDIVQSYFYIILNMDWNISYIAISDSDNMVSNMAWYGGMYWKSYSNKMAWYSVVLIYIESYSDDKNMV